MLKLYIEPKSTQGVPIDPDTVLDGQGYVGDR